MKKEMKYLGLKTKQLFFEIVFGMVHGWPYEGFQKFPIYQFQLFILRIWILSLNSSYED
jgi:hypothetical protein